MTNERTYFFKVFWQHPASRQNGALEYEGKNASEAESKAFDYLKRTRGYSKAEVKIINTSMVAR